MKTRTFLIAAVMLVALSAAAFGQAVWEVSSIPVTAVIKTGNAELPGAIKFIPYNPTGPMSVAGTVQIVYGGSPNLNITSLWTSIYICTNANSLTVGGVTTAVTNTTNAACYDPQFPGTIAALQVDQTQSYYTSPSTGIPPQLVFGVPQGLGYTSGGTTVNAQFMVVGVRLKINGTGISGQQNAYISQYGNELIANEDHPIVINSVLDGIYGVTTPIGAVGVTSWLNAAPLTTASTSGAPSAAPLTGVLSSTTATIRIQEGFGAAFTKGVGVKIHLSAAPPKGISFTFPTTAASYTSIGTSSTDPVNPYWVMGLSTAVSGGSNTSITSASTATGALDVYYYVATDTPADALNVEYLEIPVTIASSTGSETLPLTAASITCHVSLAPVEGAYALTSDGSPPPAASLIAPRFAELDSAEVNLLTMGPSTATTTLLMTYTYTQGHAVLGTWDTGVAIANTTKDPGLSALGFSSGVAVPQTGPITFYFYPGAGSPTTALPSIYTTVSGGVGSGLTTGTGNVPAGGTYVALLSDLLAAATPSFTATSAPGNAWAGYVFAVTGFTNAHGIYTVTNWSTIAAYSALMEVLTNRVATEQLVF